MGKKEKKIKVHPNAPKQKKITEAFKEEQIRSFEAKYPTLLPLLDNNLIRNLYEEEFSNCIYESEFDKISVTFSVDRNFFLKVKERIIDGDIDLEIAIVDYFMELGIRLIKKLQYSETDMQQVVETAIINMIENYTGEDKLSLLLSKELRKMVQESSSKETPKKENVLTIPKDDRKRPPTPLEKLLKDINILKNSPLEDKEYIQFLSLKYGYYNDQFYTLEEIPLLLGISKEKAREYYLRSLQYVKDWFGWQLDRYYTYQLQEVISWKKKANE